MDDSFGNGQPVRATVPTAPGRGKPHGAAGRVCGHPDCTTVLSVYNGSARCWAHQDGAGPVRSERFSRATRDAATTRRVFPAA